MKFTRLRTLPASLLMLSMLTILVSGCIGQRNTDVPADTTAHTNEKIQIVTSIPPLYSITANVAGDKADIYNLLPGDASEHQFSLKPSDVAKISEADMVIQTGLSAEEFLQDTLTENVSNTANIVSVNNGITLLASEHHDHGNEHEEEHEEDTLETDGHIWLSIKNAMVITQTIADQLSSIDSEHADYYQANATAYISELAELDTYATEQLSSLSNRNFIPLHAAWIYLANDYNLNQVAAIEVIPGQEPSAQRVATLLEEIEEYAVPALFSEPQLQGRILTSLSEDTGLPIKQLDPLGTGDLSKNLYIDTMKANIDTLANALK